MCQFWTQGPALSRSWSCVTMVSCRHCECVSILHMHFFRLAFTMASTQITAKSPILSFNHFLRPQTTQFLLPDGQVRVQATCRSLTAPNTCAIMHISRGRWVLAHPRPSPLHARDFVLCGFLWRCVCVDRARVGALHPNSALSQPCCGRYESETGTVCVCVCVCTYY